MEKQEKLALLTRIDENGPIPDAEPERQYYFMKKAKRLVMERQKQLERKLTACVVTFGCQMNARDSEKLIGIL